MRRWTLLLRTLAIVLFTFALSGCAGTTGQALRALIPGGVSAADAEWTGVKSGEPISLLATVASIATDPQTARLLSVALELSGRADPLGVLMPITPVGSSTVRWVVCTESWAAKCRAIPLNAKVHAAGQVNEVGHLKPSRIVADDFND